MTCYLENWPVIESKTSKFDLYKSHLCYDIKEVSIGGIYMTREEILAMLLRWNIWGNPKREKTIIRESLNQIKNFANFHGIIVIKGPRRAGKSTLLYQLIEELSIRNDSKKFLYVNFEDYAFSAENLQPEILEAVLSVYQQEIYQENDFMLFLDEIQNLANWDKWLRTCIDSERIKTVFITGSSSKLLSSELATAMI